MENLSEKEISKFVSRKLEVKEPESPRVTFALNEELNARMLNQFMAMKTTRGGENFSETALRNHPALRDHVNLPSEERFEKVKEYLHTYYRERKWKIEELVKTIQSAWDGYAPQFFEETKKIFKDTNWPEGQYIGYLSVSAPFPRFIDTKTFCVPCDKVPEKAVSVAAHEILHFIFYEYVRQRYLPGMENTIEREMNEKLEGRFTIPLWELSEVFNIFVLSGKEWGIAAHPQSFSGYPHLQVYADEFTNAWEESNHNIDKLFTKLEVKTDK